MTDDQFALLQDKIVVWSRASREGAMDLRDYNHRCAEALRAALVERADAISRLSALEAENKKTLSLLRELYATVMGECSGILDEDRGGNSRLALDIESALSGEG